MLPYDSYVDLMRELDELVSALQAHPDPHTRDAAVALLNGLDLLHREGLERLVRGIRQGGGGELVDQGVEEDPVVRAFLGLYDLAELNVPEGDGTEEEAPAVPPGAEGDGGGPPPTGFVPLTDIQDRRRSSSRTGEDAGGRAGEEAGTNADGGAAEEARGKAGEEAGEEG